MNDWFLEIEESEKLIPKGILCMTNMKGKKLYVKPVSHKNGFIELSPLTIAELKELSIEVQESCINSDFDIDVEESDRTPAEEACDQAFEEQKKKSFNLTNLEDVKRAEEIARKAREVLEREGPEDLQAENEDLRSKLELIASKELERKMDSLGIRDEATRAKIRESPERITGYELAREQLTPQSRDIPSGSAPLNEFQRGNVKVGFSSVREMVDYLYKNPTPENRAILDKLWSKTVQGMKQRRSTEMPFENLNPEPEQLGDSNVKAIEVPINASPDPNQESELRKFGVGKKKQRDEDQ